MKVFALFLMLTTPTFAAQLSTTEQVAVQAVAKEYSDLGEAKKALDARQKNADDALREIKKEIAQAHPGFHLDDSGLLVADKVEKK